MFEVRKLVRFTLKRESLKLYVFSLDDGEEVEIVDQLRAFKQEFEIVFGSSHLLGLPTVGITTWSGDA